MSVIFINPYRFAGPAPTYLLDTYTGAVGAYSLRQLRTGVTSVVRVRRSSDNTQSDFTATQVTDGTLTAWVGAGNNGFVRIWYDQSGNNNHANQVTSNRQPIIVTNGALLDSPNPAIAFNDTASTSDPQKQELLAVSTNLVQPVHLFYVFRPTAFISLGRETAVFGAGTGDGLWLRYSSVPRFEVHSGNNLYSGTVGISTSHGLFNVLFNTTSSVYRYNGVQRASGNVGTLNSGTGFAIGNLGTVGGLAAPSRVRELIVFPSSRTSDQVAIESNINGHYGIY